MSRYHVVAPPVWRTVKSTVVDTPKGSTVLIEMQTADLMDNKTGDVFRDGAYRLVTFRDGISKVATGKGGTVPWYGESAYNFAINAFTDLRTSIALGRAA